MLRRWQQCRAFAPLTPGRLNRGCTAGEKNNAGALYQLGLIFELGLDYRANPRRALEWYRQAAAAGSTAAAEKVRTLEAQGIAVPSRPSTPPPVPAATVKAPAASPAPATAAPVPLSRNEIAELQRLLGTLALDPGPADGVPGAKTVEAVKLYQQMGGLKVDGKLSRNLLEQMREVAGQGGTR
jgi:TPR repeat protein